jgi:hypothetical protein
VTPDMEIAHLRRELEYTRQRVSELTREQTPAERNQIAAAMARADSVARLFGETASAPIPGEREMDYRRRLLETYKRHSSRFANTDLSRLDSSAVAPIEDHVYSDAEAAARTGAGIPAGTLVPVVERVNGRDVTRYVGDPAAWMSPFMTEGTTCAWPGGR